MADSPARSDPSLELFAAWLRRRIEGDADDLDAFIRANPIHGSGLSALAQHWLELEPVLRLAGVSLDLAAGFAERIVALHGPEVDPAIGLEGELGRSSAELLKRLRRKSTGARYTIDGEIAQGGMGAILRAWDEDIRRHIAMKIVLDQRFPDGQVDMHRVDPEKLARFLEEAQVTGQLEHPSIVPVHELGIDSAGRVYFTMKLVKGRDMKAIYDLVFQGKEGWTETRALNVLLKVCEAVAYAHKKGVIHRDLKPGNVMVGDFGEVYVMDWGIARVIGRKDRHDLRIATNMKATRSVRTERREEREGTPDSPIFTMDGFVVGSPAYMSLEQASGNAAALDSRSDVYAIGAMIYHLLTGQMPYVPPGAQVSARTILGMILRGPPSRVTDLRKDVPGELVAICERAMARNQEDRYASTLELSEDLRAYLEHRVVRAYRTGAWAELSSWIRRNRGTAAALLGIAGSLLVGGLMVLDARASSAEKDELMSDLGHVHGLAMSADVLWSALPESRPELEAWSLAAQGAKTRAERYASHLQNAPESPQGSTVMVRNLLDVEIPALERAHVRIQDLLAKATSLVPLTVEAPEAGERWRVAIEAIAASPRYGGLRIRPQIGLLPLGENPTSNLWEFWVVLSGGEPMTQGAHGTWIVGSETGIVLVLLPAAETAIGSLPFKSGPSASSWDEIFQKAAEFPDWEKAWHDPAARAEDGYVEGIRIEPFFVSKYELTQGQYTRLTGRRPSRGAQSDTNPVESISWDEATVALARVGLQLPTDAQWEYACRAGTTSPFWTGWSIAKLNGAANIADRTRGSSVFGTGEESPEVEDHFHGTAPVGAFRPNAFGLYDVHGNVWEWCRDGYRPDRMPRDGDGLDEAAQGIEAKVLRGGSFFTPAVNVRSANRLVRGFLATDRDGDVGVRPCRPLIR